MTVSVRNLVESYNYYLSKIFGVVDDARIFHFWHCFKSICSKWKLMKNYKFYLKGKTMKRTHLLRKRDPIVNKSPFIPLLFGGSVFPDDEDGGTRTKRKNA